MNLRSAASALLPATWKTPLRRWLGRLFDVYAVKSYSQEGEDLILRRLFDGRESGFYVDVGAHHPQRFSNTYDFYKRGWSGINVEPNPDAIRLFQAQRRRDINLQLAVADRTAILKYFMFDDSALNSFDAQLVEWRVANTPYRVVTTIDVPVERLDVIFDRHLPAGQKVAFLSIDVEGLDLAVLRSNDWRRFRPECVLVEVLATSLEAAMRSDVYLFMADQGYELFAKMFNTLVFVDASGSLARSPA